MLDILEIIHEHEDRFQHRCKINVSGSISANYFHYREVTKPITRISYRNSMFSHESESFVMSLGDSMSLTMFSSIVKCKILHTKTGINSRKAYWDDYDDIRVS